MLKLIRRNRDLAIEGRKAHQYDEFSRRYRLQDMREYAGLAASHIADGVSVLDIATGPGYFCIELARLGAFRLTGLDISWAMVKIGRANAEQVAVDANFVQGSASALPFPDGSFELVFCSWAMKNFKKPAKVFAEMFRVLRPDGMALIIDLNHEASDQRWERYASSRGLKGISGLMMGIAFRIQRRGAYSKSQFEALIKSSPFCTYKIEELGINLCMCLFK